MTITDARADVGPAGRARARRLSRPAAFVAVAAIVVTFAAASAAPSPLYVVYQHLWGFSAGTLTLVFAVYVAGLIAALLVLGALSDHVGRRPVLAGAIALEVVSLALFLVADNVNILLVARLLQGIATGAAFTTLGAALVDLAPAHAPGRAGLINGVAPVSGLALGALGCGVLVQYAPAPTHLVWALLLAGMLVAGVLLTWIPETSARRPGAAASLAPRLSVPARLRADVLALAPIMVASWAIGGLYLSLGPSVAAGVLGLSNHLIGGLVVTLLCGTGAGAAYALRSRPPASLLLPAGSLLAVGVVLTVVGMQVAVIVLAVLGTIISGVGFGAASLAAFGTLTSIAAPTERGELLAVALVISYAAFSIPAVIAGFAATAVGLHPVALVYGLVVALLGVAAVVAQRRRLRAL